MPPSCLDVPTPPSCGGVKGKRWPDPPSPKMEDLPPDHQPHPGTTADTVPAPVEPTLSVGAGPGREALSWYPVLGDRVTCPLWQMGDRSLTPPTAAASLLLPSTRRWAPVQVPKQHCFGVLPRTLDTAHAHQRTALFSSPWVTLGTKPSLQRLPRAPLSQDVVTGPHVRADLHSPGWRTASPSTLRRGGVRRGGVRSELQPELSCLHPRVPGKVGVSSIKPQAGKQRPVSALPATWPGAGEGTSLSLRFPSYKPDAHQHLPQHLPQCR